MSMTRHDYDAIAQAIADTWAHSDCLQAVAEAIAEALEGNTNFDVTMFLAKAGVEV